MSEWDDLAGIDGSKVREGRTSMICPKCSHDRKKKNVLCLTVNNEPDNRWWNCNHCGYKGNLDLKAKYQHVYQQKKNDKPNPDFSVSVVNYFKKRGLSIQALKNDDVYQATKHGKIAIAYPVYRNKALINIKYKYLEPGENEKKCEQVPNADMAMIGLDNISFKKEKFIVITEGEEDMYSYKTVGTNNVLSVPQGAQTKVEKYISDKYTRKLIDQADFIVISTDDDEPGIKLRDELSKAIGEYKCKYVVYPEGYKDANEVLAGKESKNLEPLGKEATLELLTNAQSVPYFGVIRAGDCAEGLKKLRTKGFEGGLKCGHELIDKHFTLKAPYRITITGVPGSGKTTFFRYYLVTLMKYQELKGKTLKWVIFSPENTRPAEREFAKLITVYCGKAYTKINDEDYKAAVSFINNHFIIISPEVFQKGDDQNSQDPLEQLMTHVEALKKTENIFGWSIDPWNRIEYHKKPNERFVSDTEFLGRKLDYIDEFNYKNNLACAIIAHPIKMEKLPSGNYVVPGLYNISGSANWYNKADIGVIVHRDKYKEVDEKGEKEFRRDYNAATQIITEKIKFDELGREDKFELYLCKGDVFKDSLPTDEIKERDIEHLPTESKDIKEAAEMAAEYHNPELFNDDNEDDLPF